MTLSELSFNGVTVDGKKIVENNSAKEQPKEPITVRKRKRGQQPKKRMKIVIPKKDWYRKG